MEIWRSILLSEIDEPVLSQVPRRVGPDLDTGWVERGGQKAEAGDACDPHGVAGLTRRPRAPPRQPRIRDKHEQQDESNQEPPVQIHPDHH